jgi:phenylacetate-coenzyme A ligase PaaK-like adenylate-forming protein
VRDATTPGWWRLAPDVWRAGRADSDGLTRRQRERLDALVAHARRRSRFYAELYAPLGVAPRLDRLPVVTKAQLMARFDDWVTDPEVTLRGVQEFADDPAHIGREYLGRYLVLVTSGTTGIPAVLLQDRSALDVLEALTVVRVAPRMMGPRTVAALVRGRGRAAAVWATGRPYGGISLLQRQIHRRPSRAKRLRLFSALEPVDELVTDLDAFQPAMLSGYASVLAILAREQREGRLAIHPAIINNGGETLTPDARQLIESAFGTRVSNGYGASEMIMIAYDCGHGSMHVHADWAILEPVDADRRPVAPGEQSATVLLTVLANRVQPIIRYDLGDSVVLRPEPCACGSRLPAIDVVGRTNDVLHFAAVDGREVALAPLPLVTLMETAPGIRSVQLVQTSPRSVEVRLDPLPGHDRSQVARDVQARLHEHFTRHGLTSVRIVDGESDPQRDQRSGKLRQVVVASA